MDDLKKKARAAGIWNMFLPKNHFKDGPQFTNVEYGLMAEQLGKSITASEVCVIPSTDVNIDPQTVSSVLQTSRQSGC